MSRAPATPTTVRSVHVVMPGGVDDPAAPSGGNVYDRRICRELPRSGWTVLEHTVAGAWPRPGAAARAELARVLARVPDGGVVLVDGLVACGVPEITVPAARRLRLAVLVHLPLADETGLDPAVAAELDARERATLAAAAAVVATGERAARTLAAHHGLAAERVHVAVPGADPAPAAPGSAGGSRLLCVASVTPRKGHHLLVEALAGITDLPWSCRCVGGLRQDPGYVARLRDLVDGSGTGERLRLLGPRSGAALDACYAAADLLVLPSLAETWGMVVTEALARGLPVLTTDAGGLPEAVGRAPDGVVPGLLVPPGDPAALAAALRSWLTDAGLRRRLRAAAAARRTSLAGWERTARSLAEVLERLRQDARRAA